MANLFTILSRAQLFVARKFNQMFQKSGGNGSGKVKKEAELPDTPFSPNIPSITDEGITFYWKKVEKATGYEVFRSNTINGKFKKIADIPTRSQGTYLDSEFDRRLKAVYYKSRSYLKQEDGSITYSDFTDVVAARFRDDLQLERNVTYMYDNSTRPLGAYQGWGDAHDVQWSSSDETVAVMGDDGRILAKATGEAVLTCYSKALNQQATTKVVVNRASRKPANTGSRRFSFNPDTMHWESKKAAQTNDAVIMMAGDLMCGSAQTRKQYTKKTGWRYDDSYDFVKRTTAQSDFAIGNLETLMASAWPYMTDEAYINHMNNCNAPSRYLDAVLHGGFDAIAMSNNHNCDGGTRALKDTIAEVDLRNIPHTGAFADAETPRFMIVNINGIKVGFLAYMSRKTGFNGKDADWSEEDMNTMLNVFSTKKAKQDIANCRAAGAEYVIAYMHWGKKNFRSITKHQAKEAQGVADAGADYIVGANPHIVQVYDEIIASDGRIVPCFYSTGNFQAFMDQIPGNRDSVMVRIRLKRDESGAIVLAENGYIPYHTYTMIQKHRWAPVAVGSGLDKDVPITDRDEIRSRIRSAVGKKIAIYNPKNKKKKKTDSAEKDLLHETASPEADAAGKKKSKKRYTTQYTVKQVCDILGVGLPKKYTDNPDEILTNITCEVHHLAKGGAFILLGNTTEARADQLKRALPVGPKLIIAGITSRKLLTKLSVPYVVVPRGYEAMVKLCAHTRSQLNMTIVGVTGSVGKTSTKEMVASVLQQHFRADKNFANRNNTKGIFISLQAIPKDVEIYVQEFGIGGSSMESKTASCIPNAVLITNISDSHISDFGSRANIMKEKLKLVEGMEPGTPVFLNYDDVLLKNLQLKDHPIISYAVENKEADYYSENLRIMDGYMTFDAVHKGRRTPVTINTYGAYNVGNALAAMAVGEWAGVPLEKIVEGIAAFKTEGIRQTLTDVGGYKLYLDCYNTSPLALKNAVKALESIATKPGGKRIGVIGEMGKLGKFADTLHTETGEQIAQSSLDLFICFGGKPIELMAEKIREAGKNVLYTNDRKVLNDYVRQLVTPNDVVMFKGGHGSMLFKTVDQVYGTSFLEKERYSVAIDERYRYKLFAEAGTNFDVVALEQYSGQDTDLTLPDHYDGAEINYLCAKCFFNNTGIRSVRIPAPVFNIGEKAFSGCQNLTEVVLPESLKIIEAEAFSGCSMLKEITIPEGVIDIGNGAFRNCTGLEHVVLPASLGHLGDHAFDGCPNVVIIR